MSSHLRFHFYTAAARERDDESPSCRERRELRAAARRGGGPGGRARPAEAQVVASAAKELHGEESVARRRSVAPQRQPAPAAPAAARRSVSCSRRPVSSATTRPIEAPIATPHGRLNIPRAPAADRSDERAARLEELDSMVLRVGDGEEAQLIVAGDARRVLELARRRALLAKRAELRERRRVEEDDAVVVAVGDVERAIEKREALGELEGAGLARRRRERLLASPSVRSSAASGSGDSPRQSTT